MVEVGKSGGRWSTASMLQSYPGAQPSYGQDEQPGANLAHVWEVIKRRFFYFLIPFILIFALGTAGLAIQRPIYFAQGKILIESPYIPVELVRPTVTDTAMQRIDVIQQRITTRDNLLSIADKFGLFP